MLTVPEAAKRVGKDPETVRRWIRSGKLRSQRVGTQHLVEERDLEEIVEGDLIDLPSAWRTTWTGEPPVRGEWAVRRSRAAH
jgi:excisionase family DNA binding protein